MLCTAEEAKTKWCPQARTTSETNTVGVTVNRCFAEGSPDPDCLCLARGCMLWAEPEDANLIIGAKYFPNTPVGFCENEEGNLERIIPLGYCSLGCY